MCAHLRQQMRAFVRPAHLLLFAMRMLITWLAVDLAIALPPGTSKQARPAATALTCRPCPN
jgi:hypothetical protein